MSQVRLMGQSPRFRGFGFAYKLKLKIDFMGRQRTLWAR
jgi:hypothetical protein